MPVSAYSENFVILGVTLMLFSCLLVKFSSKSTHYVRLFCNGFCLYFITTPYCRGSSSFHSFELIVNTLVVTAT
jgi:hypothetical protein